MLAKGFAPAGRYAINWNGRDGAGRQMANGIYFVRLSAGEFRAERKLTLMHE